VTGFVAFALPMLLAHRTFSHPRKVSHAALRISLQLIVMSVMNVMIGTFPDTYGVST
jgi:hypothetical protein